MRSGIWIILATAVAVGTGIVVGEQRRAQVAAERASPTPRSPSEFQLAQVEPGMGGTLPRGGFGPGGAGRFVSGRIESVDPAAGTLTIRQQGFRQESQTIHVPPSAVLLRVVPGTVGDVKAGDTISVQGLPLELSVSELQVDPPGTPGPGGSSFGGGFSAGMPPPEATQRLRGRVTSVSPLKIQVSPNAECLVRLQPGAAITREVPGTLNSFRAGELVSGFCFIPDDGPATARMLRVSPAGEEPRRSGAPPGPAGPTL